MARAKPGMGRGLEAILSVSAPDTAAPEKDLRELPVELVAAGQRQPRERFDEQSLRALAESVRERGVLQPVLVRPRPGGAYELVAGERRWRAARMAGLDTIPALVCEWADADALELGLIENMAREDLSPVEEARACAALVEELGLTREQVGRRVGRSRAAVSNLLRLLELPDEVLELLHGGALSAGHGRALLLADDHLARKLLARSAVQEGWSVRSVEARARASNQAPSSNGSAPRERIARGPHADQEHAAMLAADALSGALAAEVKVIALRGGRFRAELTFERFEEAMELAQRVRSRAGIGV